MSQRLFILLVAFGVRLAAGGWLGHFVQPMTWEFEEIANHLLEGQGFFWNYLGTPYRAFVLPAYPLFCAAVYAMTNHSQLILLVLQCFISAFAALQVYAIGMLAFKNPTIARWGAWLVAFHPGLIFYASLLYVLTTDLFAFLWVLWAWLRFFKEPSARGAAHAGLASGLAMLSRGTILPFMGLAMLLFLWVSPIPKARAMRLLSLVLLVGGIGIAPWLVRNAFHFHRFPFLISTSDEAFWEGNHPNATGSSSLPDGQPLLSGAPESFRRQIFQSDELGQSRLFAKEGKRFVVQHPTEALQLFFKKFIGFWWFSPLTGMNRPPTFLKWYRWYYTLIGAIALLGVFGLRRQWGRVPYALLFLYAFSIAAFQSLYHVEGRHRWTVEPILLLMTASGVVAARSRLRAGS